MYIVVIPGGFWARLGGQMKKFSRLAIARHNPLHKSVNFYPDLRCSRTT